MLGISAVFAEETRSKNAVCISHDSHTYTDKETDKHRQTDRQTHRWTSWTKRQIIQAKKQRDRHIH